MPDDGSQVARIPPRVRDWEELNRRVSYMDEDRTLRIETLERSGVTAARPMATKTGQPFFDTTLGKPIWWNGSTWVDATGTAA